MLMLMPMLMMLALTLMLQLDASDAAAFLAAANDANADAKMPNAVLLLPPLLPMLMLLRYLL